MTAGTLGLDTKYEFVFRLLNEIHDATQGAPLDFENFLKYLTTKIVNFLVCREALSVSKAEEQTSNCWIYKAKMSWTLTI
jgi:hypothetical protein